MDVDLVLTTEIALFFQNNPFTVESAEGLALKLGRKTEHVRSALELLVKKQLLTHDPNDGLFMYVVPFIAALESE